MQSVVVVFIPGITPSLLNIPTPPPSANMPLALPFSEESKLPIIHKLFTHACLVRAPGDNQRMFSAIGTFMSCPFDAREKERREKERASGQQKRNVGERTDVRAFVVSRQDMEDHDYPLPLLEHPELEVGGQAAEDEGEVIQRGTALSSSTKEEDLAKIATYKETYGAKTDTASGLDWVEIQPLSSAVLRNAVKVYAIDCEMVRRPLALRNVQKFS